MSRTAAGGGYPSAVVTRAHSLRVASTKPAPAGAAAISPVFPRVSVEIAAAEARRQNSAHISDWPATLCQQEWRCKADRSAIRGVPKPIRRAKLGSSRPGSTAIGSWSRPMASNSATSWFCSIPSRCQACLLRPYEPPASVGVSHALDEIRPPTQELIISKQTTQLDLGRRRRSPAQTHRLI
jgi:hypothetical protein